MFTAPALVLNYQNVALWDEAAPDVYCYLEQAAGIPPQVKNQCSHILFFEICQRTVQLLIARLVEPAQYYATDLAEVVFHHVLCARELYFRPCDVYIKRLRYFLALNG